MSYFDTIYERVFGQKENRSPVEVSEVLKRTPSFMQKFNEWKHSLGSADFINEVWQSYFWHERGIDKNPQVTLHKSSRSNGFAIAYDASIGTKQFHFLFDYLAEKVRELDYKKVMSKSSMKEFEDRIETNELHYLKPKNDFVSPRDQKYGNVSIEYRSVDSKPVFIKLQANTYSDRAYQEPLDFEELAKYIFSNAS